MKAALSRGKRGNEKFPPKILLFLMIQPVPGLKRKGRRLFLKGTIL